MKKGHLWIGGVALLILGLAAVLVVAARHYREPVCLGKPLSYWINQLSSGDPYAFMQASQSLRKAGPDTTSVLIKTLQKKTTPWSGAIRGIRARLSPSLNAIVPEARDPAQDRILAAQLLGIIRAESAVPALLESFRDGPLPLSSAARAALAQIGEPAVPGLTRLLEDKNFSRRAEAAFALRDIGAGARSAIPVLQRTLQEDGSGFLASIYALERMGPPAVPALVQAAGHPLPRFRLEAALALGRIGTEAKAAAPVLRRLLDDRSPEVRSAARSALEKIESGLAVKP